MSSPILVLLESWPQPNTTPEAILFVTETQLFLRYFTSHEQTVVIQFPMVKTFQFGSPNDEALGGHPLYRFGLKFYSVHRIENSPWIVELERRNAGHPRHNKEQFMRDAVHYVFTFQDSTLECVVTEGPFWEPKIQIFLPNDAAKTEWSRIVKEMLT